MRSKTSSLVIAGTDANSGLGRAEGPRGAQGSLRALDRVLVHRALGETYGVGDSDRRRVAVRGHGHAAQAEHDPATHLVLRELPAHPAETAGEQQTADKRRRVRLD